MTIYRFKHLQEVSGSMLKNYKFGNGLVWLLIIFVLPLPLLQATYYELPALYHDTLMPIQFGTLAYIWMLAAIYLATRPRWLDRLIGLPSMYLVHGIISILAIGLAFVHKLLLPSSGWIKWTGDWGLYLFIAVGVYSLIFLAGWLTNRVPVLNHLKHCLETLFQHEISVWLHRLNLVATALVIIHVILIPYILAMHNYMMLFGAYTGIVALSYLVSVYRVHFQQPTGELIELDQLADNVVQLSVKMPRLRRQFQTGDFVFIAFPNLPGMKEPHPFSLANNPLADGQLELIVREDGDFTKSLASVPIGTPVKILGGYGRFQNFIDEHPGTQLAMISGGIGVVPLLSIINNNLEKPVHIFYSAQKQTDFLHLDQFDYWNTTPNFSSQLQVGRFKDAQLENYLATIDVNHTIFLVSGPAALGQHWQRFLKKHGIRGWQIYYEEFGW